ncbi:MAG: flagellar hook-basal body complex protein FliE [Proteobacteria bacterium]|nr:flagellar hook-basal body complex protein FliE [Pseudomonadota bacterium]
MSSGIAFLAPLDAMPAIDSDSKLQAVKAHDRGFAALLTQELSAVNNSQNNADRAVQDLALGKTSNTHTVMMALQQAKLELQLSQQIRNKLLESYQQIMREQI